MKINKIKINAYGKLKQKEINLKDGINIIYGENESGKSTLLRFIVNSFYGISKNKKGREYSDFEKYTPWVGEEFSGKIEYERDNKEKYEVYRDFKKKNSKIFNELGEDISKEFNIDKTRGNQFFYDQTKVDEDLFLSTVVVGQQEVKLGQQEQNILLQKIANLIGTGEDNVSYKRAIDRIGRRQLDEVGTQKSREKPINLVSKKIQELQNEKEELDKYEDFKYDIEEKKKQREEEILNLETENNFLKEMKRIKEKEVIQIEKIKVKENIKQENNKKIEIAKKKIEEIQDKNKDILEVESKKIKDKYKIQKEKMRLNQKLLIGVCLLIILNILVCFLVKSTNLKYLILLTIPIFLILSIRARNKLDKRKKQKEKKEEESFDNLEKILSEINRLKNEIRLLEENNESLENEIVNRKEDLRLETILMKEKIGKDYSDKIEESKRKEILDSENINLQIETLENKLYNKKIELHTLELEQKNIQPKLDNLAKIEEELENYKEKMKSLEKLNTSFDMAKEVLTKAYEEMKNTVTPKFTQELSNTISEITNGKYKNIMFNDEIGLIVELNDGNYVPASKLSIGTIDQLYLSLRLSMIDDLSEENMPIILDEAFAYYDTERLKNLLKYSYEKYKNHQIILLTCTNREKEIMDELKIPYNIQEM